MCRFTLVALLSFLLFENAVFTYTVDQRQTGDLNVQIDLKNLQVIALMKGKEEYVDYDYAYDYSDITIKPQNGTTKKPLNVTEPTTAASDVSPMVPGTGTPESNSTIKLEVTPTQAITVRTENMITTDVTFKNGDQTTTVITPLVHKATQEIPSVTSVATENRNSTVASADCKKGFFRNSEGSCELRLQNPSNTLLKMLKQKLKANGNGAGRV